MHGSLLAYDCHARFRIRFPNIDGHTACEAPFQAISDVGDSYRRPVRREDDLLVRIMERVEQVEEFFLRLQFLRKEMDIVHNEKVILAVLIFEPVRCSRLHRISIVDSKFLGSKIKYLSSRILFLEVIPDRLNKMRLPPPRVAVDEKGFIGNAGALQRRLTRGIGEIINRADDERVEGIARIQVIALINIKFI